MSVVSKTQAAYRGGRARRWVRRYRAGRAIQGPWRGAATRQVLRREDRAAATLGRHERARQFRREVRRAEKRWRMRNLRLTRLQALARGFTRRCRLRNAAVEALQRWARCLLARRRLLALRLAEAATRRAALLCGAR